MTSRSPSGMLSSSDVVVAAEPVAVFAPMQALFDQVAQHLLDEERVALGLAVDGLRERRRHVLAARWFVSIRCTSSTVRPRSGTRPKLPMRRSSASVPDSGCARSTSTSR